MSPRPCCWWLRALSSNLRFRKKEREVVHTQAFSQPVHPHGQVHQEWRKCSSNWSAIYTLDYRRRRQPPGAWVAFTNCKIKVSTKGGEGKGGGEGGKSREIVFKSWFTRLSNQGFLEKIREGRRMRPAKLIALAAAAAPFAAAIAPLEPSVGQVLIGAWYDRNLTDTPSKVNSRVNYKPLAFFQTDIDFSGTMKPWTAASVVIPQFLQHLKETNTDAIAYLTIYPFQGYANITDAQLQDLADKLNQMVKEGHKVLLRFASEMNGSWFEYGQDPIGFLAAWKRCITFWRNALGENKNKVAFIWSPNSGNGYPFLGGTYSINTNLTDAATLANLKVMDTNQNGKLDYLDDPYMPYYPGDDLVDWVGMSVYHYGKQWPWVDNTIPDPKEFENVLQGDPTNGNLTGYYPFYDYFSGPKGCVSNITNEVVSAGNKPLIISETAATFHFAWDDQTFDKTKHPNNCSVPYCNETATRVDVKQGWWRSFLNKDFVAKFPQMKAVSTFEFIKSEELTWRDFTTFGAAPNTFPGDKAFPNGLAFADEDNAVAAAFAADVKAGMMPFLVFGNSTGNSTVNPSKSSASALCWNLAVTALLVAML